MKHLKRDFEPMDSASFFYGREFGAKKESKWLSKKEAFGAFILVLCIITVIYVVLQLASIIDQHGR